MIIFFHVRFNPYMAFIECFVYNHRRGVNSTENSIMSFVNVKYRSIFINFIIQKLSIY